MKRDYWPELWSILGFAIMVWAFFRPQDRQDFTVLMGAMAMLRGDVLDATISAEGK